MGIKGISMKKLQYINEFLTEQLNHWLLFPFALFFSAFAWRTLHFSVLWIVFLWGICSFLPLAFFILRLKAKSLASFLILQPVTSLLPLGIATAVLLSNGYLFRLGQIICIGCAISYMFYSTLVYLKKKDAFTVSMQLSVGVAVAAGCIFLEAASGIDTAARMSYYIFPLIVSIGLFFIIIYIQRYIDFLNVNKSSAGYLPAAEMFHSGFGLAAGYTILGVAAMLVLAGGPWLGRLSTSLKMLFENILKWIVAKMKKTPTEDSIPIHENPGGMSGYLPEFKLNDTFRLWTILEYVFIFALLAVLLFLFVKALVKFIRYLQGLALSRMRQPDMDDGEAFDIREKCDIGDKTDRKKQKRFGPFSHSERIRRLYKKKLLSSTGQMTSAESKMLGIYTAREWEQKLSTLGMAAVYEQARYSGQEMTAEDVKRMKDACR